MNMVLLIPEDCGTYFFQVHVPRKKSKVTFIDTDIGQWSNRQFDFYIGEIFNKRSKVGILENNTRIILYEYFGI